MFEHVVVESERAGIAPGDVLLSINGRPIRDVFDYRYLTQDEKICLRIHRNGSEKKIDIIKEETEDLGLTFEHGLMDRPKRCANKCLFCFIDQLPKQMRETLYFKDDDARLSFLSGNYVTLTNMSQEELDRILYYHLSPINISVHATSPELRAMLLGNPNADVMPLLEKLRHAGLFMNFQVVLCKGINDGAHLDQTISDLSRFIPQAESLSIVPAGLTKFRAGLPKLAPFSPQDAADIIAVIDAWQEKFLRESGGRFVYAADEFYLKAGVQTPPCEEYEGFPQLENGVGMLSLFAEQAAKALRKTKRGEPVSVVTGAAAGAFISKFAGIKAHVIQNHFFGEEITVSGLLTGTDIIAGLKGKDLGRRVLIPANALRDDAFLDDVTLQDLAAELRTEVKAVDINGAAFIKELFRK